MSRRLAGLFLLALAGVAVAVGLVVTRLGGLPALLVFAAATGLLLGLGVARARTIVRVRDAGRTCTCCTTSQHDPVTVR